MDKREYVIYIGYTEESHIYIGISKQPKIRWKNHISNPSNPGIKRLVAQGYIFNFDILYSNLTQAEAETLELRTIDEYHLKYGDKVLNVVTHKAFSQSNLINKEQHAKTTLTQEDVYAIREMWQTSQGTLDQTEQANKYGVSLSTLHNIVHNKRWYDPNYTPVASNKVSNSKLHNVCIEIIREEYAALPKPRMSGNAFAKLHNISGPYMNNLLRGRIYIDKGGPILGRDYN